MPGLPFGKPKQLIWAIFLWLIIFISFASDRTFGQTLVLNTANAYPHSSEEGNGFVDRIIKEAFRRIGEEIKIIHLPSERALVNADQGIEDGNFVRIAGLEKQYPNLIRVPEKICSFEFVAFSRNPSIRIRGWESLRPYHIGIITGWKILEANIVGTRSLTKVNGPIALFELLTHDRTELVIFDRLQGNFLIKKQGLAGVKAITPFLAEQDMFLYLNRRHARLVPKLVKAVRAMKQDKTFHRLKASVLETTE